MTVDPRSKLVADIRRRLPYLAVGHPRLADKIKTAMVRVESEIDADEREMDRVTTVAGRRLIADMGETPNSERGRRLSRYIRAIEEEARTRD